MPRSSWAHLSSTLDLGTEGPTAAVAVPSALEERCRQIFASGSGGSPGVLQPVLLAISPAWTSGSEPARAAGPPSAERGQQHLQRGGGGGRPGAPLGGGGRRPARGALADWPRRGRCHVGGSGAFCAVAAAAESVRAVSCFFASPGSRR
ncbi:hypothetical protein J1605_005737 [Eschrichtius robustus]|uniref:Uncharacterized protein n=1 Tax=Eschrichtius robustus TaxID=9764 RepID=A0AB34H7D2_ESCRO|nr:hypothetical protein J1605_005737 [Eschrichtius robustus]